MKIVVVGLLAKQQRLLGTFKHIDVRFANDEGRHGTGSEQLFANADRILIMRNFITHGLTDKLERARSEGRTVLVRGGITALRSHLTTLNTAARLEAIEAPTPKKEEDMATERTFNFVKMQSAKSGDVFEYFKPADMSTERFKMAMYQGRSYLKTYHGVHSEQEITGGGGKCNILVTKTKELAEAPAPVQKPVLAPVRADIAKAVERLAATAALPEPKVVIEATDMPQFWRDVFVHSLSLRPSAPPKEHVECANLAVDAWIVKFGGAR